MWDAVRFEKEKLRMTNENRGGKIWNIVLSVGMIIVFVLLWLLHKKVTFIGDDIWYTTNLATGQAITGVADIWESQKWHFMNWGGRSVIHFLLQLIIFWGDTIANILNMLVTVLLIILICRITDTKKAVFPILILFMLVALNPNALFTMFWQSGTVNYLYSTTWILLFVLLYLRQVKNSDATAMWGITFWIVPLGLATGWSNENMGPASFLLAVMSVIYLVKFQKKKPPLWMWLGIITSLAGSVLVVVAPGNFVRSALVEEYSFGMNIYQKGLMMLKAGAGFLFPVVVFLLISLLLYLKAGKHLEVYQVILLITTVLAYGAMVLSPTFPNRACFGILVLCITLIISFLSGVYEADKKSIHYLGVMALCFCVRTVYVLYIELQAPLFI